MEFTTSLFENIIKGQEPETAVIIRSLVNELVFIVGSLNELKTSIQTDGVIIEKPKRNGYKNICVNPALKVYNTTIKSYVETCKTLKQYLPEPQPVIDELMQFVKDHPIKRPN